MLRDTPQYHFDYVCTTHSLDLSEGAEDHIIIPGPEKLKAYIDYRETRINQLHQVVKGSKESKTRE